MSVTDRNQEAAVAIRDLAVCYGKVEALRGVTLDMGWKSAVALLGPNGAE